MISDWWLVRHGESVGNVAASAAESAGLEVIALADRDADVSLSEVGAAQAGALGAWLEARTDLSAAWVSPYRRARQTLAIASEAATSPLTVRVDDRLRDRELGILDLLTHRGVEARHPGEAARRRRLGKYYHRPPGGESWADVRLRLRSFLGDAVTEPGTAAGGGLVVAHDAVITLLVSLLLTLDEEELMGFAATHPVLNASVTHLTRTDRGWRLRVFSDVSHLTREGAAVTVHPGSADDVPA